MNTKDYASLYAQLGRLLETAPSTTEHSAFHTSDGLQWLGRAHAAWYVKTRFIPKLEGLALYLRVHQGPMLTLSNYTQSQRAIGFGLKFVPFEESQAAIK